MLELLKEGGKEVMEEWKHASVDRIDMLMEKLNEEFEKLIG